eukprot:SAG31_NODE_4118_length_3565_cov_2.083670_8_plen_124_part_00
MIGVLIDGTRTIARRCWHRRRQRSISMSELRISPILHGGGMLATSIARCIRCIGRIGPYRRYLSYPCSTQILLNLVCILLRILNLVLYFEVHAYFFKKIFRRARDGAAAMAMAILRRNNRVVH